MSRSVARALTRMVRLLTAPMSRYNRLKTRLMVGEGLQETLEVGGMRFFSPTARSTHDTNSLLDDAEPDTLRWLDGLTAGEVLWDVGANVGAFSVYAAKRRGMRVVAFEPGAANFATLIRNVEINGLADKVDAYCVALAAETRADRLYMANTGAGHSMHGFGTAETVDGEIAPVFLQPALGFAADGFCELFDVPKPAHVKIDVDGIEGDVLRGAEGLLRETVASVLIELHGHKDAATIRAFLGDLGFAEDDGDGLPGRNTLFRKANT